MAKMGKRMQKELTQWTTALQSGQTNVATVQRVADAAERGGSHKLADALRALVRAQ